MTGRRGLLIVYTGNGKGKTTAALGTALRAVGRGFRVLMIQFLKAPRRSGELASARLLGGNFEIRSMGRGFVNPRRPRAADVRLVERAWEAARRAMASDRYDLLILDEINCAVDFAMLPIERVVADLAARPRRLHVICTGRAAHAKLVEAADLVSDMVEVRHPFRKGMRAARGIDY